MNLNRLNELADRGRKLAKRPTNQAGDWYRITNADDKAELFIYGVIGSDWDPDDVTAAQFVRDLRAITAKQIDLHLNSPGGLVFDGIAIYSALKNHAATVTAFVDGLAASAASFVAMAAEEVAIEKPAKMMIHDASGVTIGNAADHREMADILDDLSDTIAGIYADRSGGKVADWRNVMRGEKWYSADEAVKAGLADRIANDTSKSAENLRTQTIRMRHRARYQGVSK